MGTRVKNLINLWAPCVGFLLKCSEDLQVTAVLALNDGVCTLKALISATLNAWEGPK